MNLNDFNSPLYQIDKTKLGKMYGGAPVTTEGSTKTFGAGTDSPHTITYSSDTYIYDEGGSFQSGTYHLCENGADPFCGAEIDTSIIA